VLLDQVTDSEMQAGQILAVAAMVALLGARFFGRQAAKIRLVTTVMYSACVIGFLVYVLI
jgi:MFS-type transporter involved in bile tolerance (Atg22 family)